MKPDRSHNYSSMSCDCSFHVQRHNRLARNTRTVSNSVGHDKVWLPQGDYLLVFRSAVKPMARPWVVAGSSALGSGRELRRW